MAERGRVAIGLSEFWAATYSNTNGVTTYTNAFKVGRAVSWEISPEDGGDNIFYADNKAAEDLGGSGSTGETTLTIDGLLFETANKLAGITASGGAAVYTSAARPYFGVGAVIKRLSGGEITWQRIILHKVRFNHTPTSVSTQGETTEAQTQELSGTFFPDDTALPAWKTVYEDASSEAAALEFIQTFLGGGGGQQ